MRKIVFILATFLSLLVRPTAAAPMDESFTFVGACADCSGQSVGTLVVSGTPGQTSFAAADFVSFTYTSNLIPTVDVTAVSTFMASLVNLPGANDVTLFADGFIFKSLSTGYWCIGYACGLDFGAAHVWSAPDAVVTAPEPASIALLGLGLAGLVAGRRYTPRCDRMRS